MPLDEEPLDRFVNRPLARLVVLVLYPTSITPNQVSVVAGLFGIAAGAAVGWGTPGSLVAAAALLWAHLVLDCADGELARKRGGGSRKGQVIDGLADYCMATGLHLGLWALLAKSPTFRTVPGWALGILIVSAALSMALHSAVFDSVKQRFRQSLGKGGAGLESREAICEEIAKAATTSDRLYLKIYNLYAGSQRSFAGWTRMAGAPTQAGFLMWTLLGPTLRVTVCMAAFLLSIRVPGALAAYPAFGLGAANVLLVLLLISARRPIPSSATGSSPP